MRTKTIKQTHQETNLALGAALLLIALGLTPLHAATTRHVWPDSPSPAPPYDTWATAAHAIQDAVDAAVDGDTVLVTNGVYATGGRAVSGTMTNRVAIDRAITLQSVNGPEGTLIIGYGPGGTNGDGAIRCVYLGTNAVLSGFTLTNGHTRTSGNLTTERYAGGYGSRRPVWSPTVLSPAIRHQRTAVGRIKAHSTTAG